MASDDTTRPTLNSFLGRSVALNVLFALESAGGLLVDLVVAAAFGLSTRSDALYAAWKLPQAIGSGMFQSLANSFMALFTGRTDRVEGYSEAISFVTIVTLPLAVLFSLTSRLWLPVSIPGAPLATRQMAIPLAAVLAWLIAGAALAETFRAIYYQEQLLWYPSMARAVGDFVAIICIWVAGHRGDLSLAAWGATAGAGLEAMLCLVGLPCLLRLRLRPAWPSRARLRETAAMIGAPLLGQGAVTLASIGQRALASLLPPGAITALSYASRITGTLERLVFRGFVLTTIQMGSDEEQVQRLRFRLLMFIATPLSVCLMVLSRPLISIVFARGLFGPDEVQSVGLALQAYALALLGQAASRIPLGLAYSRKRGAVVFSYLVAVAVLTLLSDALLIHLGLGLRSFGLGYSVAVWLPALWLISTILPRQWRRKWLQEDGPRLLGAGLAAALATFLVVFVVQRLATGSHWSSWVMLGAGGLTCAFTLWIVGRVIGLQEADQLLRWAVSFLPGHRDSVG